jgi:succinate dehydrogenase flavin-adding protein (antitoxin of CptAB toxin-antitoxin module)
MYEIEKLKKQILYKSKSLGYRELGLVFENFLKNNIEKFRIEELKLLLEIVSMDDQLLKDYILDGKDLERSNYMIQELHRSHKEINLS